jgi:two-component system, chemotaxis family, sensor kinase Cph1
MLQNNAIESTACAVIPDVQEEPIHCPGLIKPNGILLALEEAQLNILQVSENTQIVLGIPAEELLNKPVQVLLGVKQYRTLQKCLVDDFSGVNPFRVSINPAQSGHKGLIFDGILHRNDAVVILELLPAASEKPTNFFSFYHLVRATIDQIQQATTTPELCHRVAREMRQLTGFDRVMVYQFDPEGAGSVIAESKVDHLSESYLGLHYPATDIPNTARRLFALNKVRVIPEVNYQPVALVPTHHPVTRQPLDLSGSILRSVAPAHIEYLHHMGVAGSLVIALMQQKKLWGLIACHHSTPKQVSYELQAACEFVGQVMSVELAMLAENDQLDYRNKLNTTQSHLLEAVAIASNLREGLMQTIPALLDLVSAQGCAICLKGEIELAGKTPSLSQCEKLLDYINTNLQDNIFATDCLSATYPPAEAFKDVASGLLVLTLSKIQSTYLLWFRPEVIQTVSWAGNPDDSYRVGATGEVKLCPRHSFALWKETVQRKSLPWQTAEIAAVQDFRSALVGLILRQADELAKVNVELARSNIELDAFAYIASHDLKEPLRGIHNYANFLMEDYTDNLDEQGIIKLQTLVRLSQRMENLINSLLHYSRLGRLELCKQATDLNELVQQAIATVRMSQPQLSVAFRVPRPLPLIYCDRVRVSELFTNLLSNAIKYSDALNKWVEIGFFAPGESWNGEPSAEKAEIFYVRDNGIGIPAQHQSKIFQIFRRLHAQDEYGGGTGAGLTIIQKIVGRHGGRIWVNSAPGEGSTFYFTLPWRE